MKKIFQFLFLLYSSALISQTILSSFSIDLHQSEENKSKTNSERLRTLDEVVSLATSDLKSQIENNQILSIENERTHEVFVFIKDTTKITVLRYNSALFLNNKYEFPLQNLENQLLLGCSFNDDDNPTLYLTIDIPDTLSSISNKIVSSINFNLENRSFVISNFKIPANEFAITTFQINNTFHILAQHRIAHGLLVYKFKDAKMTKKGFDFSSFHFQNKIGKIIKFNNLTKKDPIEKMDLDDYNTLDKVAKKSKVYIEKNHLFLTLDYNPKKTHAFDINLENYELNEKNFPQPDLQDSKNITNSFYQDGKLYQVNATESSLVLDVKDFNSGQTLKNISILNKDDKTFKNIPLFIQIDYRKPREIKSSRRFLQDLQTLDLGLSIFRNKKNTFVYIGGTPKRVDKEKAFRTNLAYSNLNEDDGFFDSDFPSVYHLKSVYFESILNKNFELVDRGQSPIALDKLNYFLNENENASLPNIIKFKDYYILGYYDKKTKQFIMRKFTDGFN